MTNKIAHGRVRSVVPPFFKSSTWFDAHMKPAGIEGLVTCRAFWETRVRHALLGATVCGAIGFLLSFELMVGGTLVGMWLGWRMLPRAIEKRISWRVHELERHLAEMLDVVAMGLRSGLSFDRSLELYLGRFQTLLSQSFGLAYRQWSCGLSTREEALRSLVSSYDSLLLARVCDSIIRSLRFGSSLAENLEAAAREARLSYRARKQEQVAKAPVKMMVPTGVLILPAMLLLVLGPVLLELSGGFS